MENRNSIPTLFFYRGNFIEIEVDVNETKERWLERVHYIFKKLKHEDKPMDKFQQIKNNSRKHVNKILFGVKYI